MGASVVGFWPGITEEDYELQGGFQNDCKAWGNWMAEREGSRRVLKDVRELGAAALLTFKTDGLDDKDVKWVTPLELRDAALLLREMIVARDPRTRRIVASYAAGANDVDPVEEEFILDLEDVADIAEYAADRGVTKMTLEVNW